MRVVRAAAAMLVVMVGLGLPVQAESDVGFYITPDDQNGDPDVCDESTNYAASLEKPAAGQAPTAASGVGVACPFFASYTTVEDHQLSGDFNIEFWVGCTAGAMIELDYRLTIAGQDVVDVRPAVTATCGPGQPLVKGGGVHATKDLFIPAGSEVVMRLALFAGPEPGEGPARNVYVTTGGDHPSGFSAPGWGVPVALESGGAQTVYADLETPSVEHEFANATSDTYVFNFTANQTHGVLDLQVNGTGLANVTLTDASGAELLNATAATETLELTNATAGPWQLTVGYQNFTGNLSFAYRDGALLVPPSAPPVDGEAGNGTGNGTGNNTLDDAPDDQESPGPSLLPLAVLLIAIALRRRT